MTTLLRVVPCCVCAAATAARRTIATAPISQPDNFLLLIASPFACPRTSTRCATCRGTRLETCILSALLPQPQLGRGAHGVRALERAPAAIRAGSGRRMRIDASRAAVESACTPGQSGGYLLAISQGESSWAPTNRASDSSALD